MTIQNSSPDFSDNIDAAMLETRPFEELEVRTGMGHTGTVHRNYIDRNKCITGSTTPPSRSTKKVSDFYFIKPR